jgi:hypothetical protein
MAERKERREEGGGGGLYMRTSLYALVDDHVGTDVGREHKRKEDDIGSCISEATPHREVAQPLRNSVDRTRPRC